ncbi:heterokaryon incompatibility protein [Pyrenophora teres f. teres]|uniref:Heterokaryon incompatibility protein n=1 Tax=Pyrenophora teres f. teres TaxID=97479 RepID=A0A6S6W6P7_9PLEO|nr:heterokaryon incompatibility protein [Pyrenophora teres f. teres]
MTNQYNYDPIHRSTREIRLLELLPQDGNSKLENIPSCNIFHTSLDKNPKFIALSYVWGDAKDLRVIRVKDCTVKVTKNLYEAMMTLRSLKEPLVIWIDALCINQSDEVEKSWQVGLMADIYRSAHKVTAWIGPADSDSDLVIDYLNSLGAKAEEVGFEFGHDIHKEAWSKLPSKRSAVNSKGQSMAQSSAQSVTDGWYEAPIYATMVGTSMGSAGDHSSKECRTSLRREENYTASL